jgi:DNA-binding winged helix-turn-helix (wHTH) protein/TolB-like protein
MVLRDLAPDLFQFGRFTLEPQRRRLCVDGVPVALSSRAFDILLLLIENRDRVVTKDEIFARVWPGTIVEENNLAVQISALRRALQEAPGDPKLIATVPGRGYRFVGLVDGAAAADAEAAPAAEVVAVVMPPTAAAVRSQRTLWLSCAATLVVAAAAWGLYGLLKIPESPRLSIAVLPFRNLSGDPREDSLAAAISHDLAADVSRIPGSVVIPREKLEADGDIGRKLQVRYLLDGSLTIQADAFNVNAELIDTQTGRHICCDRFNVTRDTLGADREQIVRRIASVLNAKLIQIEASRSLREHANNADALDYYLRARSVLDQGDGLDSLNMAQKLLEHAVNAAPSLSDTQSGLVTDAQAELGLVLLRKINDFGDNENYQTDHAEAENSINSALSQNTHSAIAITASGMLALVDYRCDQALSSFVKAKELDPNEVRAMEGFARCSGQIGHSADMIAELKKILTIDPASPENSHRQQLIGSGYLFLGNLAEAKQWLDRSAAGATEAEAAASSPIDSREWRKLYLIAIAELQGDKVGASRLFSAYDARYPHRSVWRIATYFTRGLYKQAGSQAFLAALQAAGMPQYLSDEMRNFQVSERAATPAGNDFDETPISIEGHNAIGTEAVRSLLAAKPKPIVLDVGRGVGLIHGATWVWSQGYWVDRDTMMLLDLRRAKAGADTPIVVMADNLLGWDSYNAARFLIAHQYRNVLWYRGGEEAWAAHGYQQDTDDMRPM